MTYFKSFESQPSITFTGSGLPSVSTIGARVDDVYLNLSTGEAFRCHDETFGSQVWHGSQGTIWDADTLLLSPNNPDLYGYWTMDNLSGTTILDESPNNKNLTSSNINFAPGHIGNAAYPIDNSALLTRSGNIMTAAKSWTMWLNMQDNNNTGGFRIVYNIGTTTWVIAHTSGRWRLTNLRSNNTQYNITTSNITYIDSLWHFIAVVYDPTEPTAKLKMYSDSGNIAISTDVSSYLSDTSGLTHFEFSKNQSSLAMDEIRCFNKALSASEVASIGGYALPL